MNLVEFISKNHFLQKMYPKGFKSLSVSSLSTDFSTLYIKIRTQDKPAVLIDKYGEWGVDYDTVEFKLIGGMVSFVKVNSWNINHKEDCDYEVKQVDGAVYLRLWKDEKWSIEVKLKILTFQSCETYLREENDYYPL